MQKWVSHVDMLQRYYRLACVGRVAKPHCNKNYTLKSDQRHSGKRNG